jgi:HSP20 family protein
MATMLDLRPEPMFQRLAEWFDSIEPMWRGEPARGEQLIRVEESMDDDRLMIRAELPGIEPDRDVDISLADGVLTISAERSEERHDGDGHQFSEFRYGRFRRVLRVPRDTDPGSVTATYADGILTIEVPITRRAVSDAAKVPVRRG